MHQIPEPWATAMIAARMTDPRYDDPRPSMGRLAEEAGLHTTTVSRLVHGRVAKPDPANVAAVAKALGRSPVEVSRWARQARSVEAEYVTPAEVNLLTRRQQEAITELIRAMAEARESVMGNAQHPAPRSQSPGEVTGEEYESMTREEAESLGRQAARAESDRDAPAPPSET